MIELALKWGSKRIILFSYLGRLLLPLSDDINAESAFQYQQAYHNGVTVGVFCDGCGGGITATTGRTVCRRCADVDLCRECFSKHDAGTRTRSLCAGHSFFEVNMQAPTMELQASWLQSLAVKYSKDRLQG